MHHHTFTLHSCVLALAALLLGGCALQPKPKDLLMAAAPKSSMAAAPATIVTSGGFCVTLSEQGTLLTQPCDQSLSQQFSWDVGALQLAQRCLIANGADELAMADCQDGSRQWQWQDDRLFNRQASLCLDVAGSRHKPAVPLRLAECFGGANQSFEWKRSGSMLDLLSLENLAW